MLHISFVFIPGGHFATVLPEEEAAAAALLSDPITGKSQDPFEWSYNSMRKNYSITLTFDKNDDDYYSFPKKDNNIFVIHY